MKHTTFSAFLPVVFFLASPATSGATGQDMEKLSFDEIIGAHFSDVLDAARSPKSGTAVPAAQMVKIAKLYAEPGNIARKEAEIKRCPPDAVKLNASPDPDLYTYVGFRYVRSDESTCSSEPSDKINYQQPAIEQLSFKAAQGKKEAPLEYTYNLKAREYNIKRDFFFIPKRDGTRLFYFIDSQQYTGNHVPESAKIRFLNRPDYPILPWETPELFALHYGNTAAAALKPKDTGYEYDIRPSAGSTADGNRLTVFDVTALRKLKLTPPEDDAVTLTLTDGGKNLILDVRDSRTKYYIKEKLGLRVRVLKNIVLWPDKLVYEIDVNLGAAPQILLDLSDPKWDEFKKEATEAGHEYYVEWSFRRTDSKISTGEWIDKEKTAPLAAGGN